MVRSSQAPESPLFTVYRAHSRARSFGRTGIWCRARIEKQKRERSETEIYNQFIRLTRRRNSAPDTSRTTRRKRRMQAPLVRSTFTNQLFGFLFALGALFTTGCETAKGSTNPDTKKTEEKAAPAAGK